MYGFGPCLFDSIHDLVDHNIGLVGRRWADMHRLVRHAYMQRVFVSVRINRHRFDAHQLGSFDYTTGDFATVCDQDFLEHGFPRLCFRQTKRDAARRQHPFENFRTAPWRD